MALLPNTGLETHPDGVVGLAGIINGNWGKLETILTPLVASFTTGAVATIDFKGRSIQEISLAADATFSVSNQAAGARIQGVIRANAATRALTWPAGWKWVGSAAPATLASGKTALLELFSTGTAAASMVARWTVEP